MKTYRYFARDQDSNPRRGEIESPDERGAVLTLRSNGLFPITITEKAQRPAWFQKLRGLHFFGGSEIVIFTRQLSTMVAAGLPLTDGLDILRNQTTNPELKAALASIVRDIEGGVSFANALGRHSSLFSQVYVSLIRAGEAAGVLDNILIRLAENLEKDREFKSKTKGALIYPTIVIIAMIIVTTIMMVFVVPKLTGLYQELGTDLPLPTKIMMGISHFMVSFWYIIIVSFIALSIFLRKWAHTTTGRLVLDRLVLRIPVWGSIQHKVILSEITRTLSLLIGAGIPIIEALQIVAKASGNTLFSDAVLAAARQVERGYSLSQPLSGNPIFPPIVFQMVKTGESTGKLDEILLKLSLYFEGEAEHEIKGLTVAIEPIIMIILGIGVAFLVMSIILPIYKLTSSF